jgi:hypothetical protein
MLSDDSVNSQRREKRQNENSICSHCLFEEIEEKLNKWELI